MRNFETPVVGREFSGWVLRRGAVFGVETIHLSRHGQKPLEDRPEFPTDANRKLKTEEHVKLPLFKEISGCRRSACGVKLTLVTR